MPAADLAPVLADALTAAVAAVLGLVAGRVINRLAGAFPWPPRRGSAPVPAATTGAGAAVAQRVRSPRRLAVRTPVVEVGTAALFALAALHTGLAWELPAYLHLAGVAVLLTLIDVRHRLLPNRVLAPAYAGAALLLALAAAAQGEWAALARAGAGGLALFAAFLALALISPRSLGMGDVKLAGLLGMHLGWVGWAALATGAAAGFVLQAALALALLASGRIGRRAELPFGPAMLAGAAIGLLVQ